MQNLVCLCKQQVISFQGPKKTITSFHNHWQFECNLIEFILFSHNIKGKKQNKTKYMDIFPQNDHNSMDSACVWRSLWFKYAVMTIQTITEWQTFKCVTSCDSLSQNKTQQKCDFSVFRKNSFWASTWHRYHVDALCASRDVRL